MNQAPRLLTCPDDGELLEFEQGRIHDAAREETLADHLGSCARCETRFDQLSQQPDTIVELLRQGQTAAAPDGMGPTPPRSAEVSDSTSRMHEGFLQGGAATLRDGERQDDGARQDKDQRTGVPVPAEVAGYRVSGLLGHGSFGIVYEAADRHTGEKVAIKVPHRALSDAEAIMARREAEAVAELAHPGIVRLRESGTTADGRQFLVMDYVAGESLRNRLRGTPIGPRQAAVWVGQLAEALHHAHSRSNPVYHRDVKPANILIDRRGKLRLTDFGLAMREDARWNHADQRAGSWPYMSPEQVRGEAQFVDGRSDIWSLGVILYEMLAGRRPFQGTDERTLEQEILNRPPRPLRTNQHGIPRELDLICQRCLEKAADRRYATAADLADDLRRYLARPWYRAVVAGLCLLLLAAVAAIGASAPWRANSPGVAGAADQDSQTTDPFLNPLGSREVQVPTHWQPWRRLPLTEGRTKFWNPIPPGTRPESLPATELTFVVLTEITEEQLPYEMRYEVIAAPLKDTPRGIFKGGVFIGYRYSHFDPETQFTNYRYQYLPLLEDFTGPSVQRFQSAIDIRPNGKLISYDSALGDAPLAPRNTAEPVRYQVHFQVSANGLEWIRVNNQPFPLISTAEANAETELRDYIGGIGILHHHGKATYRHVEIRFPRM